MRPLRLDLHGFTVFREPTTVDLTDADFFALVGPTGSGKSTVLDAICFALYGTVPRWGDRRRIENALAPSASRGPGAAGVRGVRGPVRGHPGGPPRRQGQGLHLARRAGAAAARLRPARCSTPPRPSAATSWARCWPAPRPRWTRRCWPRSGCRTSSSPAAWSCPRASSPGSCTPSRPSGRRSWSTCSGCTSTSASASGPGCAQREAEAKAAATRSLLGDVTGADDARPRRGRAGRSPPPGRWSATSSASCRRWSRPTTAGEPARTDAGPGRAASSRRWPRSPSPAGVATLGDEVAAARDAAGPAEAAVHAAEEREEKVRAELATAGDRDRACSACSTRTPSGPTLAARVGELAAALSAAQKKHAKVERGRTPQRGRRPGRPPRWRSPRRPGSRQAQTADRAGTLRVHLVAGEPCPVCEQTGRRRSACSGARADGGPSGAGEADHGAGRGQPDGRGARPDAARAGPWSGRRHGPAR